MKIPTRVTMARVAMRAAIWSYLSTIAPDGCADVDIDNLTSVAVNAVNEAVSAPMAEQAVAQHDRVNVAFVQVAESEMA